MDKKEAVATQQFVAVENIKQDAIILRGGGLRKILLVNGINFDLKSEEEQGLIIYAFQSFLNALNFSVQIAIRSRKINIENYLGRLLLRQEEESNQLLKNIIGDYRNFISSFVSQNAIMEKSFFVVVPYDPLQLPKAGQGFWKKLTGFLSRKKPDAGQEAAEQAVASQQSFEQHLTQLDQRVNEVVSGLTQIGLRAVALNNDELIELFYNIYNPELTKKELPIQQQ